ncbi:MAG: zinc ribbon domain-containing protein [Coriobacteriia bacterium]|nr:zinc ribbon domain-containing protein [Coriobacteriia bacterium]
MAKTNEGEEIMDTANQDKMRFCTKCGTTNDSNSNFCINCGATFEPVSPARKSPTSQGDIARRTRGGNAFATAAHKGGAKKLELWDVMPTAFGVLLAVFLMAPWFGINSKFLNSEFMGFMMFFYDSFDPKMIGALSKFSIPQVHYSISILGPLIGTSASNAEDIKIWSFILGAEKFMFLIWLSTFVLAIVGTCLRVLKSKNSVLLLAGILSLVSTIVTLIFIAIMNFVIQDSIGSGIKIGSVMGPKYGLILTLLLSIGIIVFNVLQKFGHLPNSSAKMTARKVPAGARSRTM